MNERRVREGDEGSVMRPAMWSPTVSNLRVNSSSSTVRFQIHLLLCYGTVSTVVLSWGYIRVLRPLLMGLGPVLGVTALLRHCYYRSSLQNLLTQSSYPIAEHASLILCTLGNLVEERLSGLCLHRTEFLCLL